MRTRLCVQSDVVSAPFRGKGSSVKARIVIPNVRAFRSLPPQIEQEDLFSLMGIARPQDPHMRFFPSADLPKGFRTVKGTNAASSYQYELTSDLNGGGVQLQRVFKESKDAHIHGWICDFDPATGKPLAAHYDVLLREEGYEGKTGKHSPGIVNVTIVYLGELSRKYGPFMVGVLQYRPLVIDNTTGVRGSWVYGPPGGYTVPGVSAEAQAAQEAIEEAGAVVKIKDCRLIARNVCTNRSEEGTGFNVAVTTVSALTAPAPDATDERKAIPEKWATLFPLRYFPWQSDAIDNNAIAYTQRALGMF